METQEVELSEINYNGFSLSKIDKIVNKNHQ